MNPVPATTRGSSSTARFGPFDVYRIVEPRRRRLVQVVPGLVLFGAAMALTVEAALGVDPWTVFHDGVAQRTGLTIGTITVLVGLTILALFPLFGQPIGLGTLLNALLVGPSIDVTRWLLPELTSMTARVIALGLAPVVLALGSGLYLGAGLGPGPRDGLMTALHQRGVSVWLARGGIEFSAVAVGWLLGGDVGLGTIWMATAVAALVDVFYRPPLKIDA